MKHEKSIEQLLHVMGVEHGCEGKPGSPWSTKSKSMLTRDGTGSSPLPLDLDEAVDGKGQLLAWVQNPTPILNLNDFARKCSTPAVDPFMKICNGMLQNEAELIQLCPFVAFPFYTCYGCPSEHPTPSSLSPE